MQPGLLAMRAEPYGRFKPLPVEAATLLEEGRIIDAVKSVRASHNLGLREAKDWVDAYIASVAAEFGVPILDARLWLEEDDFYDSHHVLKRGADKFTVRFARELPTTPAR